MHALNIVFAGTPPFAAHHLEALLTTDHNIIGVYTQPDRAAGRGKQLQASAVKLMAQEHGLSVFQPASLRTADEQAVLSALKPDLMIVVAYGLLLPQAILDIPRYGCINVHGSLLPRWRGAAPIERALLAGDDETGVTIMQMDKGLDTGAMLYKINVPITDKDDRQTLESRLAEAGKAGLLHCMTELDAVRAGATPQDDTLSTYAHKLEKSEALLDWSQNAEIVNRTIRCGIGRTPAYSFLNGERVRILKAEPVALSRSTAPGTILDANKHFLQVACADSALNISLLQLPGKNALPVFDILNSRREQFATGNQFSAVDK